MNWPKFAKRLLLADGQISEVETTLIRRAVMEDGVVDKEEIEFLVQLKREATSVHPLFDELLFDILTQAVLADEVVTDAAADWLRRQIFADGEASAAERAFVARLRTKTPRGGVRFDRLCDEVMRIQRPDERG